MFSISVLLQVAGYAEWFNLSSLPASGLMCRERQCLGGIKPCECGMVVGELPFLSTLSSQKMCASTSFSWGEITHK